MRYENNCSADSRKNSSPFKFRNDYFDSSLNNSFGILQKIAPKPTKNWINSDREMASNIKCCPENVLPIKTKKAQPICIQLPINATLSLEDQYVAENASSFNDSYDGYSSNEEDAQHSQDILTAK